MVLSGEAILVIEGEERPLRRWDFVHCPPEAKHVIVGAGDRPCLVLAARRAGQVGRPGLGRLLRRRDRPAVTTRASTRRRATPSQAYARFPARTPGPGPPGLAARLLVGVGRPDVVPLAELGASGPRPAGEPVRAIDALVAPPTCDPRLQAHRAADPRRGARAAGSRPRRRAGARADEAYPRREEEPRPPRGRGASGSRRAGPSTRSCHLAGGIDTSREFVRGWKCRQLSMPLDRDARPRPGER